MVKHILILILSLAWWPAIAFSPQSGGHILNGRLCDQHAEAIFAANVYLKQQPVIATASDLAGNFQLWLPASAVNDTLVISFVGYITRYIPIRSIDYRENLSIVLREDVLMLSAAVIENDPRISEEFSIEKLNKMDIYLSPVSSGDPLNAITLLPASTNTSENANPEFRGSHANASQVILNGIPISNPVRNTQINGMGNLSLFNAEIVEDMTVYAGNPPLTYGNSIAGMAEINTARKCEKNLTQISASMANVGLLRTQRLGKKSFFQLYGNYQFSKPYLYLNNIANALKSFRTNDIGLNFHADWGNFSVNTYSYFIDENFTGYEYAHGKKVESLAEKKRNFNVINLRYHTHKLFIELNSGNNYSNGYFDYATTDARQIEKQYLGNLNFKYFFNDNIFIQTGISGDDLSLDYDIHKPLYYYASGDSIAMTYTDSAISNHCPEVYLYTRIKFADCFILGLGARKNISSGERPSYLSYQASLRYNFLDNHSLLLAGGSYHGYYYPILQYPHFSWQQAKQISFEYNYSGENTRLKAAVYQKEEDGLSYFMETESTENTQRKIRGAELSVEQTWNHLNVTASYTYLSSDIKQGDSICRASNSMPYMIKGVVGYTNNSHFTIACAATFRPGLYYTPIIGGLFDTETQSYQPIYGAFNSKRYRAYKRFDLSLNKVIFGNNGVMTVLFATLSNVFNMKNECGLVYMYDYSTTYGSYYMQEYAVYFGAQITF